MILTLEEGEHYEWIGFDGTEIRLDMDEEQHENLVELVNSASDDDEPILLEGQRISKGKRREKRKDNFEGDDEH